MTRNHTTPERTAPAARDWPDAWLLDAFRRAADPRAEAAAAATAPCAWEALEAAGVPRAELVAAACALCAVPAADLARVGPGAAALLSASVAQRYGVVPVRVAGGALEAATANPNRAGLEEDLAFAAGSRVRLLAAAPADVRDATERIYAPAGAAAARPSDESEAGTERVSGTATEIEARILAEALAAGASDIHIEPAAGGRLLVRLRVDGSLYDALEVPAAFAAPLVSRLKVSAGLDIADRLRPQDGRIATTGHGRAIDLRVSSLPLGGGREKVVIRILDSRSTSTALADLGFLPAELHRFEKLLGMREGMVLVTGPTGSGKTTTLYSALGRVRNVETNVVTVEDPIEYRLEGISQVQVNEKAGLTFAAALRSILRQDPDVILVGEIRDGETAGIAVKASMTGHLVLSTLHTNDAPSAIARMQDVGADLGALAGALKGVVAQRLIRRVCPDCSEPVKLTDLPLDQQMLLMGRGTGSLRRAVGCPRCRETGYRGRMVVAEVLVVSEEMQRAIARGADVPELAGLARAGGMQTLWEAGIERVVAGLTTVHELVDNVAAPMDESTGNQSDVDALLATLLGGASSAPAPSIPAAVSTPACRPASAAPTLKVEAPSRAARPTAESSGDGSLRVLVVDDDRDARRALRTALEAEGFRVIEAADGEAGLAYARRLRPDLIVADVALPRLDAAGLVQALAEDSAAPPVFIHTAQDDPALLEWMMELGARDVLPRGMEARVLAARLRGMQVRAA
jgi:type II secretory ATPase GspE/PulE/Tfp pilus assembly ATPase PilB-like protein